MGWRAVNSGPSYRSFPPVSRLRQKQIEILTHHCQFLRVVFTAGVRHTDCHLDALKIKQEIFRAELRFKLEMLGSTVSPLASPVIFFPKTEVA